MSRGAQTTLRQADITRAIKAVVKAGVKGNWRVEWRTDGSIILDFNGAPIAMSGTDDLDSELAEFEARHGQG